MEQLDFFQIPSPCIGVCTTDERGYCQGCMRKREERFTWLEMTNEEKKRVIRLCQQRYRRKLVSEKNKKLEQEGSEEKTDNYNPGQQPSLF